MYINVYLFCVNINMAGWKWYVPYVPPVKKVKEHVPGDWVVEVQWVIFTSNEWHKTFMESVANKIVKTLVFWGNEWVVARKLEKWEKVE